MSKELADLKKDADTLLDSIEKIKKESTSFADARDELNNVANQLNKICDGLQTIIHNSESLISEVNSIAVQDTVEKLCNAEASIVTNVELTKNITVETKNQVESAIESHRDIATDIKHQIESAIESHKNITIEMKSQIDDAIANIKQKMMIMGGIAIFCSIAAIVIAIFIK